MTQTIVNLGTGGAALNGQNGSTAGADSNDALFLDWPGDNGGSYLYCAGSSSNYPTVPDEAALDITGAIDLRVHVAMENYSPAADHVFFAKGTTNASTNYRLTLRSTSILQFRVGDGSTSYTADSSVAVNTIVDDLANLWLRLTYNPTTGNVEFFYGFDGLAWTQLGITKTVPVVTPTTNSNSCEIMGRGTSAHAGKLYRAQILDGIDGTTVLDVDCSQITTGAAESFTALTGQTVTINRSTAGRKSVAVVSPVWLFGTDDYMEVVNNALLNFNASDSLTLSVVIRQWNTVVNAGRYVAKQPNDSTTGYAIRSNSTNYSTINRISDGSSGVSDVSAITTAGSLVVYSMGVDRAASTLTAYANKTASGSPEDISAIGSLVNSDTLRIGRNTQAGTSYQDFELLAVAVFRRALASSDIGALVDYYQARLS